MTTHDLADRIVGSPEDGGGLGHYEHRDAYDALVEIETKLDELMQRCAQAMRDAGGVSAAIESGALNKVAEILGIEGVNARLSRLYEED